MVSPRTEKAIRKIVDAIRAAGGKSAVGTLNVGGFDIRIKTTPRTGNAQIYFYQYSTGDGSPIAQFSLNSIIKKRYPRRKKKK